MTLATLTPSAGRATEQLAVSVSSEGPAAVVALRGEVDVATLPVVREMLDRVVRAHDGPVVVELAGTRFIDSGTVRALAQASRALGQRGHGLTIRSPSPLAIRVFGLFGLCDLIVQGEDDR